MGKEKDADALAGPPTTPVPLTVQEIGYIMGASIHERADKGDPVAQNIYRKLKAASIAGGVVWVYGESWWEPR